MIPIHDVSGAFVSIFFLIFFLKNDVYIQVRSGLALPGLTYSDNGISSMLVFAFLFMSIFNE